MLNKFKVSDLYLAIIVTAIFLLDLLLPLGMAVGFGYLFAIYISSRNLNNTITFVITAVCSILLILGVFISPKGSIEVLLFNRGLAIIILYVSANILVKRKNIEAAFKESQARLSAIVESAMDAIITINSKQEIILFNKSAEKVFGYTTGEILGESINILLPSQIRDTHRMHINNFGQTGVTNRHMGALGALVGLKKNGEEFPIEASISQIQLSGEKFYTVILRDITRRKKNEDQISASLKEKEVLLKEVHHRVKNNLQIISSLLSLQSGYVYDKNIKSILVESQNRIKSMALIHEKLYQTEGLAKIDIGGYINNLANNLFSTYHLDSKVIRLTTDIDDVDINIDTAINLGLIINELVTNSLKYAFPDDKNEGKIIVSLKTPNHKAVLKVKDNGVGFPKTLNYRETESLGLQLVNTLVEQLEGSIELDCSEGTEFTIVFY